MYKIGFRLKVLKWEHKIQISITKCHRELANFIGHRFLFCTETKLKDTVCYWKIIWLFLVWFVTITLFRVGCKCSSTTSLLAPVSPCLSLSPSTLCFSVVSELSFINGALMSLANLSLCHETFERKKENKNRNNSIIFSPMKVVVVVCVGVEKINCNGFLLVAFARKQFLHLKENMN